MKETVGDVVLLGTSHIAEQSVEEIKDTIQNYEFDVVCIELDRGRLEGLYSKKKPTFRELVREVGAFGALFSMFGGYVQKKLAKDLGVEPGLDMKAAFETARDNNIPIALIDVPIKITLKRLSSIPLHKKIGMFFRLIFSSFKKEYRKKLNVDIKKGVPDEKKIIEMLSIVEKEMPQVYDILIEKRNKYMVKKIKKISEQHSGKILAVVGAGHVKGMRELLEEDKQSVGVFSYSFKQD